MAAIYTQFLIISYIFVLSAFVGAQDDLSDFDKSLPLYDENVINTKDPYLLQKLPNETSYLVVPNPHYKPATEKPPTTRAPIMKPDDHCPTEFEGIPVCVGLPGVLTQLRNTSCWFTKPLQLDEQMVVVKLILYSVLVVISYLGNIYIICVGLFDWFLSRQAFCQGLVGLAFADIFIVSWYYSEDILTAKMPIDGYWPTGEVGCVCREMFVNITFALLMFIIVILFHERKHDAIVAETKFTQNPQLYHIQRQFSNNSHISSQGGLIHPGMPPAAALPNQPHSPVVDPYSLEVDSPSDSESESGRPPCCMPDKMRTKVMTSRQMVMLMLVVLMFSFVRGVVFANMLKYTQCAIDDGTMFPSCEPDNMDYMERLAVFMGDAIVVYVLPIVLICYYSKCLFYQLYMPYHNGQHIIGHQDRTKKFVLIVVLAMMTFIFLLPERALFVFVKVTKITFDLSTNVFIRLLIYLNCAFKPLLYGLLYREMYYPLLILMMGVKDARKPEQPSVGGGGKAHNQPSLCVDEQDDDDEPSMTQEEYERRLAEEDQSKPSQVMIEVIREKVRKQKEREERSRLSSMCSSNNSLMYMRQSSDQSNGSGGLFFAPQMGKNFSNLRQPIMPYMHRSSSCSDPYPYIGRPKLHSVSGSDPYYQQTMPRNHPAMYNNFYTMGRGVGNNNKKRGANISSSFANGQKNVPPTEKLLVKTSSTEIPYFSQQNVYSTSPRKPKPRNSNSESLSAHGYDNMPASQRLSSTSSYKRRVERNSSKRSDDGSEKLNTIDDASPVGEDNPNTPLVMEQPVGRLGEERSSSSSNGSACTEVTNVSAVSLSSSPPNQSGSLATVTAPPNHRRLNSTGSASIQSASPTPPSLPPRSPNGVLMFETINEQSPFDFSSSAI